MDASSPSLVQEVTPQSLVGLISRAHAARGQVFDAGHEAAFRLFNGFTEGCPNIVIDLYADTALVHNYSDPPETGQPLVDAAVNYLRSALPWLGAIVLKSRNSPSMDDRHGRLIHGAHPAARIVEHDVHYAIDLTMSRDASLFLDTRNLRRWMKYHARDSSVLNTFAYTGSIGVAALAGGAPRVIQVDRSGRALDLARESCRLNGFEIHSEDFPSSASPRSSGARIGALAAWSSIPRSSPPLAAGWSISSTRAPGSSTRCGR